MASACIFAVAELERIISARAAGRAYRVGLADGLVVEESLPAELLPAG